MYPVIAKSFPVRIAPVSTVNFHLWEPCNMRCSFCFATFQDVKKMVLPKGHLSKDQCVRVVELLSEAGFSRINFAGGEPMLCPWLTELAICAKQNGMQVSIITNGSKLTNDMLLSWKNVFELIGISIDSVCPATNLAMGRAVHGKKPIGEMQYREIIENVHANGFALKINTVVNAHNADEDLNSFIEWAQPGRWKIFKALPIDGQNDRSRSDWMITDEQFEAFIQRHAHTQARLKYAIVEDNEAMTGTYMMVDPAGRFYDNVEHAYTYSRPILEVGVEAALCDIRIDPARYQERGGDYAWS
ncbi:MAG: viperin family antiviral radical SAM protein [Bacteroidia bacterium]|nr:viperin family antiviral radical SAM protein [Bacteroidia bacterium]